MKRVTILLAALMLAGCTTKTPYGDCIGAFDDAKPGVQYRLSVRNTILAVVFVETVFVPVLVVANEARCPIGKAAQP